MHPKLQGHSHAHRSCCYWTQPTLSIWHGGNSLHTDPGDKVAQLVDYMYEPVASTLLAAAQPFFRARNASLDVRTIGPEAMANTSYWFADALKLCHGSVFVWLGIYLSNTVPWERLHKLGVRIIYYQTEVLVAESVDPKVRCLLPSPLVDEVWDFSWHNIDFCRSGPRAPQLRYVPLGSLELVQDVPLVTRYDQTAPPLVFFGQARTHNRPKCWQYLSEHLPKKNLQNVHNAWTGKDFATVLTVSPIHVNIHKNCEEVHNPVTFRFAKLLNSGVLLISEFSYPKDEEEFEGLVSFVNFTDIPSEYWRLANMSGEARRELAQTRRKRFAKRFHPPALFERAGIYDMLEESFAVAASFCKTATES